MKKYALCNEEKLCSECRKRLTLVRKRISWQNLDTGILSKKDTNVYTCKTCNLDHVMKGTHIDNSGWSTLIVPLLDESTNRKFKNRNAGKSSKVKVYYDPSVIKKVPNETLSKENGIQNAITKTSTSDKEYHQQKDKAKKGIRLSQYKSKNCGNCKFYSSDNRCSVHGMYTSESEFCKRYQYFEPKIYLGGRFSPK